LNTTKKKFDIAIVLINYHNHDDTYICLESIFKSSIDNYPFVLIVDNSLKSNRINQTIVQEKYPYNHLIYNDINFGFSKSNNIAIKYILNNFHTNYIFILNNDTIINADTIPNLLVSFLKDKEIVISVPKILTLDKEPKIWYSGGDLNFNKMSPSIFRFGHFNQDTKDDFVNFATGCAMLIKTSFLNNFILFDENFFMYDEDYELSIRLFNLKKKIFYTNNSIVLHKCQGSQSSSSNLGQLHPNNLNSKFYLENTIKNRFYIINKHFNGYEKSKYKLYIIFYFISKSFHFLVYRKFKISFYIIKLIIKNLF